MRDVNQFELEVCSGCYQVSLEIPRAGCVGPEVLTSPSPAGVTWKYTEVGYRIASLWAN